MVWYPSPSLALFDVLPTRKRRRSCSFWPPSVHSAELPAPWPCEGTYQFLQQSCPLKRDKEKHDWSSRMHRLKASSTLVSLASSPSLQVITCRTWKLLSLCPVAAGRAQVQQEPSAETTEGGSININCSHPKIQTYEYIHWYRLLPGRGPAFIVSTLKESKEVQDPPGTLFVAADRQFSVLQLSRPRLRDAAVYYCLLRDPAGQVGAAAGHEPPRAGFAGRGGIWVWSGSWAGRRRALGVGVGVVTVGRAQVQQEPLAEASKGTSITITCSHPNVQGTTIFSWYWQLLHRLPQLIATGVRRGEKVVPDPPETLLITANHRCSVLHIAWSWWWDIMVYYCAGQREEVQPYALCQLAFVTV
ncbi:uncharacterized protein [Apteryx mantelli]|uniref:Ig-like domain-containing protein n=1 Tax=Apteryx mantelli TaxID=2696672 RepID=A0ABM4FSI0_9AVES